MAHTSNVRSRDNKVRVTIEKVGREVLHSILHARHRIRVYIVESGVRAVRASCRATGRAAAELTAVSHS